MENKPLKVLAHEQVSADIIVPDNFKIRKNANYLLPFEVRDLRNNSKLTLMVNPPV